MVDRRYLSVIVLLISVFVTGTAYSNADCEGFVTLLSLSLDSQEKITLSLDGGPSNVYLCSIGPTEINDVPAEACRAFYATLMAAKITDKKVLIRFYDHNSCASIPAWANVGRLGWTKVLRD